MFPSNFGTLTVSTLKKSSNMPKIWQKMKKGHVQLALKPPFLRGTSKAQNPGFGYPIRHYCIYEIWP